MKSIVFVTLSVLVVSCWAVPVLIQPETVEAQSRTILGLPALPNIGSLISFRTIPGLPNLESLTSGAGLASLINPSISIPGFSTFRSMMTSILGLFPNFLSF